jgi:hypothetical protein
LSKAIGNLATLLAKRSDREINNIPQDNRSHHKIESACTMMSRLEVAIVQTHPSD